MENKIIEKIMKENIENSKRAVKRITCRNCGGVVVKNYIMALACQTYGNGKRCLCKYPDFSADKEGRFRKN